VTTQTWTFQSIARVHSPLTEKFGLPRQPGLVKSLQCQIEILPPYDRDEAFRELSGYSHIWLLSVFHMHLRDHWQATVRPPRLGGNDRVGVFASRAPYRPNPIGLSLCALQGITREQGRLILSVNGCDLVDGTPVIDIKPYLPYTDSVADARAGFAPDEPARQLSVSWSPGAQQQLAQVCTEYPDLQVLVEELLAQDPRPAYQRERAEYGMRVYAFNIRFSVNASQAIILSLDTD
jgi:tRNA (adenine37-N6)-methyltransferase